MKYVYSNWQNRSGTIPVTWNQLDYTQRTTWRKHIYQKGYTLTSDTCSDIYGQNIGVMVPDTVIPVFDNVRQYFALDHLVCSLSKYTPAMILPWHSDDFPTFSKNMGISDIDQIVRIIIFYMIQHQGINCGLRTDYVLAMQVVGFLGPDEPSIWQLISAKLIVT